MTKIKSYKNKKGKTKYMFKVYLGIDKLTGKRIETTRRGFDSKKAAQLALNQLKIDYENDNWKKEKNITFDELFNLWLESYKKTVRETTLYNRIRAYDNHIKKEIGDIDIDQITILKCQYLINKWAEKHSYLAMLPSLNMPLEYAVRLNLIELNPLKRVIIPSKKNRGRNNIQRHAEKNYLSKEELIKLLDYTKNNETTKKYTLYRLLAFTGCRIGEILALNWNDINFDDKTLSITKGVSYDNFNNITKIYSTKTDSSKRIIYLDDETINILKKWRIKQSQTLLKKGINALSKNQLIFESRKNSYITKNLILVWVRNSCTEAGVKQISPHGFRHTHATLLLESGVNIKEIQARLGHSKIEMTLNTYAHVTNKANQNAIEKLTNFIAN